MEAVANSESFWKAVNEADDKRELARFPAVRVKVVDALNNNKEFRACAAPAFDEDDFLRAELEATKQQLARTRGELIAAKLSLEKAAQEHEQQYERMRVTYNKLAAEHREVVAARDDLKEKLERERVQRDKYWRHRVEQEEARTMDALTALELERKTKVAKISEN